MRLWPVHLHWAEQSTPAISPPVPGMPVQFRHRRGAAGQGYISLLTTDEGAFLSLAVTLYMFYPCSLLFLQLAYLTFNEKLRWFVIKITQLFCSPNGDAITRGITRQFSTISCWNSWNILFNVIMKLTSDNRVVGPTVGWFIKLIFNLQLSKEPKLFVLKLLSLVSLVIWKKKVKSVSHLYVIVDLFFLTQWSLCRGLKKQTKTKNLCYTKGKLNKSYYNRANWSQVFEKLGKCQG